MGRVIDPNKRWTEDEKEYLRSRGRGYLIPANERRFGTEENPIDAPEGPQQSVFYDNSVREKAVYDVGGAPLPDTTLDYNTGRVMDRDNGQLVEYTGPGHTPGAYDLVPRLEPEGFTSVSDDGDDIDEDIIEEVTSIPNITELKKRLKREGVEISADDKREDLEDKLAIHLHDKRVEERKAALAHPGPQ